MTLLSKAAIEGNSVGAVLYRRLLVVFVHR